MRINPSEIQVNPASYVDPNGRVFEWKEGIYRSITPKVSQFYRSLLNSDVFVKLQNQGLIVKTHITEYSLERYDLILKHDRISVLSYCVEWPAVMLKNAALLTLDMCIELAKEDLTLQDAIPWNIFFEFTRPVFVDISSIVPFPKNWLWVLYQQFCHFFLYPLYISSAGMSDIARAMLYDYLGGIREDAFSKMFPLIILSDFKKPGFPDTQRKIKKWASLSVKKYPSHVDLKSLRIKFISDLRREISKIHLPVKKTIWYKYYQSKAHPLKDPRSWNLKQKNIAKIIDKFKPKSIIDIGCSRGWYSMLAASRGCKVVAFDRDEGCISQLYIDAKKNNLNILPLVMDILNPTPSFGWKAKQFSKAEDRFKGDMVFSLALIHHLIFNQHQDFKRVVLALKDFVNKWLLIEYISREDEKVKIMWKHRCSWYNLENLVNSLRSYFKVIDIYDSYPSTRKLILCEKVRT